MALISKANIEVALNLSSGQIPDSVYTWATKQFFILTGLSSSERQVTYRKLMQSSTSWLRVPYKGLKEVTAIALDGDSQTFTLHTSLKFNPDTGLIWFSNGFGGGQLVEITITLDTFTPTDIHDLLLTLLCLKQLSIFVPDVVAHVKMEKIGNYQKQFSGQPGSLEDFQVLLAAEIQSVLGQIQGDDGSTGLSVIQ